MLQEWWTCRVIYLQNALLFSCISLYIMFHFCNFFKAHRRFISAVYFAKVLMIRHCLLDENCGLELKNKPVTVIMTSPQNEESRWIFGGSLTKYEIHCTPTKICKMVLTIHHFVTVKCRHLALLKPKAPPSLFGPSQY